MPYCRTYILFHVWTVFCSASDRHSDWRIVLSFAFSLFIYFFKQIKTFGKIQPSRLPSWQSTHLPANIPTDLRVQPYTHLSMNKCVDILLFSFYFLVVFMSVSSLPCFVTCVLHCIQIVTQFLVMLIYLYVRLRDITQNLLPFLVFWQVNNKTDYVLREDSQVCLCPKPNVNMASVIGAKLWE